MINLWKQVKCAKHQTIWWLGLPAGSLFYCQNLKPQLLSKAKAPAESNSLADFSKTPYSLLARPQKANTRLEQSQSCCKSALNNLIGILKTRASACLGRLPIMPLPMPNLATWTLVTVGCQMPLLPLQSLALPCFINVLAASITNVIVLLGHEFTGGVSATVGSVSYDACGGSLTLDLFFMASALLVIMSNDRL